MPEPKRMRAEAALDDVSDHCGATTGPAGPIVAEGCCMRERGAQEVHDA